MFPLILGKGKYVALLVKIGAGKTTLMRILLGLIRADKGEIESVSQHKIGSIIESPALYPKLDWTSTPAIL